MFRFSAVLSVLVFSLSTVGCIPTKGKELSDQAVAEMETMVSAIDKINSPADVPTAVAQIQKSGDTFVKLMEDNKDLTITKSEADDLQQRMNQISLKMKTAVENAIRKVGMQRMEPVKFALEGVLQRVAATSTKLAKK